MTPPNGAGSKPLPPAVRRLVPEALPPEALAVLAGPVGEALAQAAGYAGRALSENTKRAYESDWRAFCGWCAAGGIAPLPAPPVVVAGHLASLAQTLGRSGLRRRLAAIAHHHRQAGHPWETRHPAISATLRGILATHGKPARPAAALTSAEVKRLLASCGSDTAGLRDQALLLLGFAGALRRSELVAINREHLRFTSEGMTVFLPRSKRDQEGEGATIGIPRGLNPLSCPVRAVEAWLRRTRIEWGAVFRRLSPGGALEDRLSPQGVWKILRRRATLARLTVDETERLSPHGLRAGFITEAYLKGALDEQVMHHTRQKSLATTQGYRRRAKITRDSPARLLDL
ncbi:Site-specific recombinase XerD [Roseomonas rosea]|uniref:Site-specific recombinase XerD n=2 Tax=Roseomonadaceae TaxID=3385906 RepID=A0A1M6S628_9PROT|nr:tyrosine-type recombinase/integrase [Roseomonas rosea]PHK92987.1 integrase [Pseudoroseomonas rhizosphaerae]PZR08521.1 MAG: integrase [Azospirillum brasilense]SHK40151.1 Site-specific recombinase XerD [Roseomonas rosea]